MTPQRVDAQPASLYQIEHAIVELFLLLEEAESEGDSAHVAVIQGEIDKWTASELRKVDGVVAWIRECESRAAIAVQEANRLKDRAKMWQAKADRVKDAALRAMQDHNITEPLHGDSSTLAIKLNPPSLDVNETDLPPEYKTFTVKGIDYDRWRELLGLLRSLVNGAPLADWLVETCEMTPLSKPVLKALLKKGNIPGVSLKEEKYRLEME